MNDNPEVGPEIVGAKVRLLPGFDEVYTLAYVGSLGMVKDFQRDEYGYSKVWIEWDQDDWHYNGEVDQWTYPQHFAIVEPGPTIEEIARQVQTEVDEEKCPHCGSAHSSEEDELLDDYISMIATAFDDAAGSEGFMLVTVHRDGSIEGLDGYDELVPVISTASMSEEAVALLNTTLSQISRIIHLRGPGQGGMDGRET